jgi:alkylation response protein AidB-like acyl-CoA dehydrogenase
MDGDMRARATASGDFDGEEAAILDAVRRFVAKSVRPALAQLERSEVYPEDLVAAMRELGLFGLAVPEGHGGLGLRLQVIMRIMEELAAGWTTLAAYLNSHMTVAYLIKAHGTAEQQLRYLPAMASGRVRGALCLTEPSVGSDLQAITTVARPAGSGARGSYLLTGTKIFVTNGARASLLAVLAKTDPGAVPSKRGISLLLVDADGPGVAAGSSFGKMAHPHVDTVEILFQEAVLPPDAILGDAPGRGMQQLLDGLEVGRLAIAASAVGLAAAALAEARRFAAGRRAFGVSIDQHQAVQLRLAEMATRLVAARLLTAEAARLKDSGARADMACGMAKLFASEACLATVGDALRIHGGHGLIQDFAVERLYREAPLYVVGEGTNDIQKLLIARRMLAGAEEAFLGLPQ